MERFSGLLPPDETAIFPYASNAISEVIAATERPGIEVPPLWEVLQPWGLYEKSVTRSIFYNLVVKGYEKEEYASTLFDAYIVAARALEGRYFRELAGLEILWPYAQQGRALIFPFIETPKNYIPDVLSRSNTLGALFDSAGITLEGTPRLEVLTDLQGKRWLIDIFNDNSNALDRYLSTRQAHESEQHGSL